MFRLQHQQQKVITALVTSLTVTKSKAAATNKQK